MQAIETKSNKLSVNGLVLLFGTALVAGLIVGGIVHLVSSWMYLIILFPALMGLALGWVLAKVVRIGKVRVRPAIILAAIFTALVAYGSMFFFDYLQFNADEKQFLREYLTTEGYQFTEAELNEGFDILMKEETGASGFLGFVLLRAREGVSISRVGGSDSEGMNLGALTWVYWLIELVIIAWCAISMVKNEASQPFCENCDKWYGKPRYLGGVANDRRDEALALIKAQQFEALGSLISTVGTVPSLHLSEQACDSCTASPYFLDGYMLDKRKDGKLVKTPAVKATLSSSQNALMLNSFKSQNAQN